MGNARMRAEQINYGASNVKVALDDLDPKDLIALSARMDTIEAWKATVKAEEKTGASVEFTNALALNALSVSADISAVQDLHGYDKPWVGGAGANIFGGLAFATALHDVSNESTIDTTNKTVTYKRKKTPSDSGILIEGIFKPNTQYTFISSIAAISGRNNSLLIEYTDSSEVYLIDANTTGTQVVVSNANMTIKCIKLGWYNNDLCTLNYEQCGLFEGVLTAADFAPYENICPISGYSTVTITDTDSESHTATVTVALGSTVYGGTLNLTTGELTITHANIASYNGETIGEPWISSMDEYVQGGTPTTGAQVVYTLASPTTTTLTAEQVALVAGYNRLSANTGNITVEAYTGAPWGGDEA